MAYDFFESSSETSSVLTIEGSTVELPDASFVRDAALHRDGMDLVLDGPHGTVTVEGYFAAESAPDLTADGGLVLTPNLVNSFVSGGNEFAQAATMNDASPVGAVHEVSGDATITHTDGSVEKVTMGTHVYQGDIIETSGDGAVNISFIDDTSFAVSNNARLAIDEYVFDPATEAGSQNFSVLKGVFVFTSGLIGRDDPDDVNIDMPSGSIGIRGTIIAGDADTGEVTVVEGAIVVRDHLDNELTLDDRFETARIDTQLGKIHNLGQLGADDVSNRFDTLSNVAPTLFSSIEDAAVEEGVNAETQNENNDVDTSEPAPTEENFDANGTVDGDGDTDVDGTVDEGTTGDESGALDPVLENADGTEETAGLLNQAPVVQTGLGIDSFDTAPLVTNTATKLIQGYKTLQSGESERLLAMTTDPLVTQEDAAPVQNTVQEPQDPDTIVPIDGGGSGGGGGGAIPVFIRDAQLNDDPGFGPGGRYFDGQTNQPDIAFFRVSEGQSFNYDYANEFLDPGDTLTFSISGITGPAPVTASLVFNPNGTLSFDTTSLGGDTTVSFTITATDSGSQSVSQAFTVDLIAPDVQNIDGLDIPAAVNNASEDRLFTSNTVTLGANGNFTVRNVFLGNGNDNLTIANADNNTIYLGDGLNSVTVNENTANVNNTIFGGSQSDTFTLLHTGATTNHFVNTFYGMDGNDTFVMETFANMIFSNLVMKGGAGTDTLSFQNAFTATLNFADINGGSFTSGDISSTTIRGMEIIDLQSGDVEMSLSAANVFDFTDSNNRLRIDGDAAGDSLTLTGLTDTGLDDSGYDVYQGMHAGHTVTLLVDQDLTGNVTTI